MAAFAYDYVGALRRLSDAIPKVFANEVSARDIATAEFILRDEYVKDPALVSVDVVGTTDVTSVNILGKLAPAMALKFDVFRVSGDGNCMYRAVSLALYGTEEYHLHLRYITALEMLYNSQRYDQKHAAYENTITDVRILVSDYPTLLTHVAIPCKYSELMHMYALSSAIGKPIFSYHPQVDLVPAPVCHLVVGPGVRSSMDPCAVVMWTMMSVPQNVDNFLPNHFALMVRRRTAQPVVIEVSPFPNKSPCLLPSITIPLHKKKKAGKKQRNTQVNESLPPVLTPIKESVERSVLSDSQYPPPPVLTTMKESMLSASPSPSDLTPVKESVERSQLSVSPDHLPPSVSNYDLNVSGCRTVLPVSPDVSGPHSSVCRIMRTDKSNHVCHLYLDL